MSAGCQLKTTTIVVYLSRTKWTGERLDKLKERVTMDEKERAQDSAKAERIRQEKARQVSNDACTQQARQQLTPQALRDYERIMARRAKFGW